MYVARVPNRGSPPAILLRESYREGGKVKNRTLANLTRWPQDKVEALSRVLKGQPAGQDLAEAFDVTRSLPHGHVAAVLGTARRLGIEELIDPTPSRRRDLVVARLVAQVIDPGSKLAFARGLRAETATSSLGEVLGLSGCDEDDLYAAMDWALARKDGIENALAARHLTDGTLVLYDVSSAAFEGRTCPLGKIGHARDGVKGRLQIVYGLLCSPAGIPIAIEVFEGNTADPKTLAAQITKLKTRFGLSNIALVGDRGMITSARIDKELRPAQLDWISALRAPQINALVNQGALQLSLFDQQNLFEITHPDYPGERLVCCHNPALAHQRARKRDELLAATEAELAKIAAATSRARRPLRGKDTIALKVGTVRNKFKMAKHFDLQISDDSLTFTRKSDQIAAEAALDGIYVLRTSLPDHSLGRDDVVGRYKDLADVERFFRTLNSELDVRPIRHRLADRVRAHLFLRMLSYYISWHMKQALAPILFADNDKPAAAAKRADPVAPAQRSDKALAKAARKRTEDNYPVHSFTSLLADLATICANTIQPTHDLPAFTKITNPTPLQRRAFELLDISHRHGLT
ncbi:IS1634 family transposase [Mycobacterium xenopi]|uniref:Transposase n=2 Tax=Mycobacterium xenopi TaxID=1789 RepID=A0AAD1M0B8_MYCXE|nr:IS1634 family transposase [Mycobacterium xenopi]MDA3641399.1 IS1634 family transposase [Mycobacterium xenopi]MDA3659429.1 IS1634 family transposase [Mycobacterium xenopi]ORX20459.1 tail length tape measure protein [Mycobacterium xenopi]SPX93629.1 Transposase [Mycobacterium xenopi]BBU21819.1 transposase [Mycobacterium xenopi]